MKIVIIGAGSAMFTIGVVSDLITTGLATELALVDIDPEALETAQKLTKKMIDAQKTAIKLVATTDRRQVLRDATVVIATIGVGGRRAWEQDIFIPRKYGVSMPVGDTAGPGGTSRALRMIPVMVEISRDIIELAPNALFFNYANPMSPICYAVHKTIGAPMVGLCIGTWHTVRYLANTLGVESADLSYSASGINHLTWFSEIYYKGQDAIPMLKTHARNIIAKTQETVELAKQGEKVIPHTGSPFESSFGEPFTWQSLLWFDAFPSPGDRHITEFSPRCFGKGTTMEKLWGLTSFVLKKPLPLGTGSMPKCARML